MRASLAMGIHFHQPVGNFDDVIARACDNCYWPFLEVFKKYPEIKMSFHFTGCLLEWIEINRPKIIDTVRAMVNQGQIEIMSGGFYEPILASIPRNDRISQIELLNKYIKHKFSYEAKGAWVAERIWEPGLPSIFYDANIKYIILDDTHFLYSGINKNKTYGYYMTEDNGKTVAVFPSDKVLRYSIPFRMPHEAIEYMRNIARDNSNPTFVYGDDGEKFGEWPGTAKWVYEEKWLVKFLDELKRNSDWLSTKTFSECLNEKPPLGKVYLPTSSYEEMLEWALPVETQILYEKVKEEIKNIGKEEQYKPFMRGGFWRNFLTKYPESNHMNKKMIYVSKKIEALNNIHVRQDKLSEIKRYLFRGQCNCAYWHGVFGGLYLFHLRSAIYHNLIKSEAYIDKALYGDKMFATIRALDFDTNGFDEVIMENPKITLYFSPAEGGTLKEIDSKIVCHNLMNILTRRKEAYHEKIIEKINSATAHAGDGCKTIHDAIEVTDKSIADYLVYDKYERYGFIDHFLPATADIENFSKCAVNEEGDFAKAVYNFETKRTNKAVTLLMHREGVVNGIKVLLNKKVVLEQKNDFFTVEYAITNKDDKMLSTIFAPEINLTMPDADSFKYSISSNGKESSGGMKDFLKLDETSSINIADADKITSCILEFSEECHLWHFPVKTVSQSEKAYELNYQASCFVPKWKLNLAAGETKEIIVTFKIVA
ncbi:4-alpha-glucanotransferase [Candidatus Omnitrophus magneticus]|uniref:4-alpha-glucanotransferase n=1 Tax=Candidatus Omnitrophus magneticus TaxID=1609969 RepID=A0A0F0CUM9_9BACT|nr:4-alpha-glucanotransferase [Candidatus Omnitrophus magneticus]